LREPLDRERMSCAIRIAQIDRASRRVDISDIACSDGEKVKCAEAVRGA
jgi:hypothetical protein